MRNFLLPLHDPLRRFIRHLRFLADIQGAVGSVTWPMSKTSLVRGSKSKK
jgi:hypothetical protein